uniref:MKRN2 opposite strand protein n=1 Tax=Arion vulgaris TaxID=1028688 RepID=A0A0B7BTT5_9EUPU
MAADFPDLRSFQHCRKDIDLVCFRLPETCPLCGQSTSVECRIPPYVLTSPLSSSHKTPQSVVLKPTHGEFLRNYSATCNLHIGVTDGNGYVCDFDEDGLHQGTVWPECLLVISCVNSQTEIWDQALSFFCKQPIWDKLRYKENDWNCFDFVFQFLHCLKHPEVMTVTTRAEFCDKFVVHKGRSVEGYVNLYRQAEQMGCVVVPKKN